MSESAANDHGKLKGLLWLISAGGVAFVLTVGLPYFAKFTPWSIEERAARLLGDFKEDVCDRHPDANLALAKLVDRLYPQAAEDHNFPLSVQVLKNKQVNAFAFLGGHIYIYSGLLKEARSGDEVAGVLAHEIEHVKRRHIVQGVFVSLITLQAMALIFPDIGTAGGQLTHKLLTMKFSREQEQEADEGGLKRLQAGHIDTSGFQNFFARMAELSEGPALLSDHPASDERRELAKRFVTVDPKPALTLEEFRILQDICVP